MTKKRKIIILMLVTIELLTMFLMYKSSHNKKIELDKVELRELIDRNSFAVYLDGVEYTGETFPERSILDMTKTQCMNEYGEIIDSPEITYINNTLTISNTETTYCTLYFERLKASILRYDNTNNRTNCDNVQCAIDELYTVRY